MGRKKPKKKPKKKKPKTSLSQKAQPSTPKISSDPPSASEETGANVITNSVADTITDDAGSVTVTTIPSIAFDHLFDKTPFPAKINQTQSAETSVPTSEELPAGQRGYANLMWDVLQGNVLKLKFAFQIAFVGMVFGPGTCFLFKSYKGADLSNSLTSTAITFGLFAASAVVTGICRKKWPDA